MTDAFIYDHVRTPRGRGKVDGALHEVTTLNLATQALAALKDRNSLDPAMVDDVVMGCVDPVGEAGGDIARVAAICAGYGDGVPGVQINRFCASGLDAVNFAAAEVMSGQHDMTVGGGVESMSRVGIGASGGAWPVDPAIALKSYFLPQGISADLIATKYGFSRDDVDAYAVESQRRAAAAWDEGVVDFVRLYVTPRIIGSGGVAFLQGRAFASADLIDRRVESLGPDVLIEGYVHGPR